MIPDTILYLIFIRLSILGLRLVLPLCITYSILRLLDLAPGLPLPVEIIIYAEIIFYFLISLPRQLQLNNSAPHTTLRTRQERQDLFEKSLANIPDLEACLTTYFRGANLRDVHREDLKDFLAWMVMYKKRGAEEDQEELEAYARVVEIKLGWEFVGWRGRTRPSQCSIDRMRVRHKPLVFYVIGIGGDDLMTYLSCWCMGLRHYRLPLKQFFTVFPFRPHTLLTRYVSASKDLSYWYGPHTSKTRSPILFIHGIGAGLRTYTGFLKDFIRQDETSAEDGQVGIIALELMPISMRITKQIPPREELVAQILQILARHGWENFTIMAHSYGSTIATHLLQELRETERIGPMLLVDPVTLCIHWGDVPYNFIYRHPRKASEWQLHYFASTDMCIAHSITRAFDWTVNVLWKEDMVGRMLAVVLAEQDIIMDTKGMAKHLVGEELLKTRLCNSKEFDRLRDDDRNEGNEVGVNVIWYDGLNHAGVFDHQKDWTPLVEVLWRYCGT